MAKQDWQKAISSDMKCEWVTEFDWPDNFDFETDPVCQQHFKPFIEDYVGKLAVLDKERQDASESTVYYIFHEHAERAGRMVENAALHFGLNDKTANNLYWATLAHDLGKAEIPASVWAETAGPPPADIKSKRREHTDISVRIINERLGDIDHPFKDLMLDMAAHHHEKLNGQGKLGLTADQISGPVRILQIIEDLDGGMMPRPHYITEGRDLSAPAVMARMRTKKYDDGWFDKRIFDDFDTMVKEQDAQNTLERKGDLNNRDNDRRLDPS